MRYGDAPQNIGIYDLKFEEYMHYMYLPIAIDNKVAIPKNLSFGKTLINDVMYEEISRGHHWKYIYVTARRGYATPGNPLNRPGWHSDGFGTEDINYVWTDRYPTLFALGDFGEISEDHIESAKQFEDKIKAAQEFTSYRRKIEIVTYADKMLQRLDPTVIHAAPEIPAPGGERSFFKVSFSNEKYNLIGNAHNYGLSYDWEMFSRQSLRNDPSKAGKDAG